MPAPAIVVAGGGIAGLTLALALARRGLRSTLLEQAAEFFEVGAGIQLSPNAARLLIDLGLEDPLRQDAVAPAAVRILQARSGRTLTRLPLGPAACRHYGAPYWSIHRGDLQRTLLAALRTTGLCDIRTHTALTHVHDSGGRLALELDGAPDMEARVLVGADGLHSRVRRHVLDDGPPRFTGHVAWRALADPQALPDADLRGDICLWLGRDAHLVHYPVCAGTRLNIVVITAGTTAHSGWSAKGDPDRLHGHLKGWPHMALALLHAVPEWRCWALHEREPAWRWSRGACMLIGDAAHPMLPFQAQGGAMAIEDAHLLAATLADALPEAGDDADAVASAFQGFERARMARVARVQGRSKANGRLYHLGGPMGLGRDLALAALPASWLLKRQDWLFGYRA